jgi:SAM-dependent methyltransferase
MTATTRTTEGWWQQVDDNAAEAYERYLVPAIFAGWAADLVDLAAPRTGERVLDVACGSGIVARTAAPRVGPSGTVVGIDINPGMLDVAREAAAAVTPAIAWQEGKAEALPFDDDSFDVVICQQGLQFSLEQRQAVEEMRRVLAPRGRLVVAAWAGAEQHAGWRAFDLTLGRHLGTELTEDLQSVHALGDIDRLRDLFNGAGFAEHRIRLAARNVRFPSVEGLLQQIAAISPPVAAAVADAGDEGRTALLDDLEAAMRPHTDDDGVTFPFESYVVTASA